MPAVAGGGCFVSLFFHWSCFSNLLDFSWTSCKVTNIHVQPWGILTGVVVSWLYMVLTM